MDEVGVRTTKSGGGGEYDSAVRGMLAECCRIDSSFYTHGRQGLITGQRAGKCMCAST